MKKIYCGALLGLMMIVLLVAGSKNNGAPILTYVYSNSMEPSIKVNDAFIVWPSIQFKVGDIVMFRPVVLQAEFVTHRIIAIGDQGFITKGDNSPYSDQDSGEPEVTKERIVGRVLTLQGQPIIFAGLGNLSKGLPSGFGVYARYLSLLFLMISILALLFGNRRRKRKPRHRLRLKHIYRTIVYASILIIIVSIYLGSRVEQINYLVSEYPGTLGDQVEVKQIGQLSLKVENHGVIPVWPVITSIAPLSVQDTPVIIWPKSSETIRIQVSPQEKTGRYLGYVQIYQYPSLLPRAWVAFLHKTHPVYAIGTLGLTFGLYLAILLSFLNRIHGLEGWIPIRALKDKILNRRWKRVNARMIGKGRVRI